MKHLERLKKKLNMTEEQIIRVCAQEHFLKNIYKKKELKEVDIEINDNSIKLLSKITKSLKVSLDAVVASLLYEYIENQKNQTKQLEEKKPSKKKKITKK